MSLVPNNIKTEIYDLWSELWNNFLPLEYFGGSGSITFELIVDDVRVNRIINTIFWIFLTFSFGFAAFSRFFQIFLTSSAIKFYKRKQLSRAVWDVAFHSAAVTFLFLYHKYMISPELVDNTGRLFPKYDNTIFFKSQPCERFQLYTLAIITYFLHSALLDVKEADYCEAASKVLYSSALVTIIAHRYENYFVVLSLNLGIFYILTEFLLIFALQISTKNLLTFQFLMALRILSWAHLFVNLLPFKYLVPTLFAKNFKLLLNILIWLWYGMSIWNSPVLQYFYHQIYHSNPMECVGEGSASRCILLKDSIELRHYKTLYKAYLEVRLAHRRKDANNPETSENASARAFQAIKCVMALKRKLKRIRGGRGTPASDDEEDESPQRSNDD